MLDHHARYEPGPGLAERFATWLGRLRIEEPQHLGPLSLVPLSWAGPPGPRRLLLHEAIARGVVRIGERGGGRVTQVVAKNLGDGPVLVLEGETLVGGKQNRVVVQSLIVPAGSRTPIEVRCIERDRWAWTSYGFTTGSMRASPLVQRSRGSSSGSAIPDQRRMWSEIGSSLRSRGLRSRTRDYHALLAQQSRALRDVALRFRPGPTEIGVIALHAGALVGMEATDHPDAWQHVAERTIPAYLVATDPGHVPTPIEPYDPARTARATLRTLRGARIRSVAPESDPWRSFTVDAGRLEGQGLWSADCAVHFSAHSPAPPV